MRIIANVLYDFSILNLVFFGDNIFSKFFFASLDKARVNFPFENNERLIRDVLAFQKYIRPFIFTSYMISSSFAIFCRLNFCFSHEVFWLPLTVNSSIRCYDGRRYRLASNNQRWVFNLLNSIGIHHYANQSMIYYKKINLSD